MSATSAEGTNSARRSPAPAGFRAALEGVRGLAFVAVLLYHAGLPTLGGGYVGLDVFFVLSGFLITGLLLKAQAATGRIDLMGFYARRARRLVPAAVPVIVITLLVALWLASPLDRSSLGLDAAASATSVANLRFALVQSDYFAPTGAPSPFTQFWSLSVEEQYYLIWPALIILLRIRGGSLRGALTVAAIGFTSFVLGVILTNQNPVYAYYLLPTRGWALAVGGLLAIAAPGLWRLPRLLTATAGWAGLALVIGAAMAYGPDTPYPGTAALVVVAGSAGLVAAGETGRGPARLLSFRPMTFLGRISYSGYLWHYPILLLVPAALGLALDLPGRLALALAVIPVAALSQRFIETPFRTGSAFKRIGMAASPRRVLPAAFSAIVVTVLISAGAVWALGSVAGRAGSSSGFVATGDVAVADGGPQPGQSGGYNPANDPAYSPSAVPSGPPVGDPSIGPSLTPSPEPSSSSGPSSRPPASAMPSVSANATPSESPAGSALVPIAGSPTASIRSHPPARPGRTAAPPTPTAAPTVQPASAGVPVPLPTNVQPPLGQARNDFEVLWRDGCFTQYTGVEPRVCSYGTSGTATIALVGDSHAAHWFPAVSAIAKEHGWKVVTYVKFGCPFADMPTGSLILKRRYTECEAWRLRVLTDLAALHPDLTIVGMSRWIVAAAGGPTDPVAQGDAIGRLLSRIPGKVGLIVDNPVANIDVPACLAANVNDIRACAYPRSYAFGFDFLVREREASRVSGAPLIDLATSICPGRGACPAVVNGYIVFRDSHHLTASFAASLAPAFEAALAQDGLLPSTAGRGPLSGG